MALNTNRTNVDFSFRHVEQVDKLGQSVGGVVATIQSLLDSRAEDNLTDVNNVKTTMRSVTVGDSGAHAIGSATVAGITGNTVHAQISNLLPIAQAAQAGTVLPGTVNDVILSNTAGQIKDVVSGHTTQLAENTQFDNDRFFTKTLKITSDSMYTAWPQDKCFVIADKIFVLYNQGLFHSGSDLNPYMQVSQDGGMSYEEKIVIYENPDPTLYTRGVTCWGAGAIGTTFYAIILLRGADTTVANYKHIFIYGNPEDKTTWVEKEVSISKGGHAPNQFHSFASLPDGSIVFGYNYVSGEVGIAKTFDLGTTWETHIMFTDLQMSNDINNCEPTIEVVGANVYGFLRGEGRDATIEPKFWRSYDNCQTFVFEDCLDIATASPTPLIHIDGKLYAFQSERVGECRAYLHEALVSDVLANGYSAFTRTFLGNLNYNETNSGSGAGVGSLVTLDGDLYIFFSSDNETHNKVDIYETIIRLNKSTSSLINLKSGIVREKKSTTSPATTSLSYSHHAAQTITTATDTVLKYLYKNNDVLSEYTTSTGVFKAKNDGLYYLECSIDIPSATANDTLNLKRQINGIAKKTVDFVKVGGTASQIILQTTVVIKLMKDETVEFLINSTNGTTTGNNASLSYLYAYRV